MGLSNLQGKGWDVVVGGLGLGYTAAEALRRPEVNHLVVVEMPFQNPLTGDLSHNSVYLAF